MPLPLRDTITRNDVEQAARTIVEHLAANAETLTVADTAEKLGEALGVGHGDPLHRAGLASAVRAAIASAPTRELTSRAYGEEDCSHPRFVTYLEDQWGWVHIPWEAAHVTQLRFMVEFRRRQVDELERACAELEATLRRVEERAAAHPEITNCAELLRKYRRKGYIADANPTT